MASKVKNTPPAAGGDRKATGILEKPLKWVGATTAILSLIFGIYQLIQHISDVRERQRQTAELYEIGKLQESAADYAGAWDSFGQALAIAELDGKIAKLTGQLGEQRLNLRLAQEDLAILWVQNARAIEGQSFSDIVDRLMPVLNRGVANAGDVRKADLLAHVGWANFLRRRDGRSELDPERQYRQALVHDPDNPYAHAYLAHWMFWRGERLEDARRHFTAALASGRARELVREFQTTALSNGGGSLHAEYVSIVYDMWKKDEKINTRIRNRLNSIYANACAARNVGDDFGKLMAVIPATAHIALIQALLYNEDFDKWRAGDYACLARLLEEAGQIEKALQTWRQLRRNLSAPDDSRWGALAGDAIQRLSPGSKGAGDTAPSR